MSHIIGNRNSTPEAGTSSLRPPASRNLSGGHHLRQSADMAGFGNSSSSLANRGIRPASEVYYNQAASQTSNAEDAAEKAAQQWIADIDQYETTLEEMAAATLDQDFKEELSAIEQWFRVLAEPERTASLYALLQQTTQVQIRFFIQVLQQMAKNHPMAGVLSPANFNEKDPMSARMSDAMSKLNIEGSRNSFGFGSKPPLSPGGKRNSTLDANTINSMFPDAAAAIAKQKAEFQEHTGNAPPSNRNSTIGDRTSQIAPKISAPDDGHKKDAPSQMPPSPWNARPNENQNPISRPKSSSSQQPMGQFNTGAGLRSPRPLQLSGDANLQNTTISAPDQNPASMPMLSPYNGSGNWASMVNTPMVSNFTNQQSANQADMVANATAMKLAALSTVNNRIQLDDARKYRRARSSEGQSPNLGHTPNMGLPNANILMTNELGQVLTPQQAATLQAQQLAAMQGRRSRPNSPGIALHSAGLPPMNLMAANNGFLSAGYDGNLLNTGLMGLNPGMGMNMGAEGYLSDHSEARGRSPRGRRGTSKPPEDPTDPALLNDIPGWLRTLRLHKYTDNLKDMRWQDLVNLDDEGLEKKGVNALGARRKLLKVFEQVREAQGEGKI
ncbi:hypothetical protein KVT40_007169 [Elsinoe batatas]|uniref:RNA-binding protein VTS1 n=1 Tax=Elsinoe batatas TaxID=2601811 RepID=A0A8K0L434_9PEZI|nr:hypothetical protein KVT40_007169 [Elsinoe batatas]